MNLPANLQQYQLVQKNPHAATHDNLWGGKTPGIQKGDKKYGVILGITHKHQNKIADNSIVIRCLETHKNITVVGCKSLAKQLHVEQNYPFMTLVYNVGDAICVTYDGSIIADRGDAAGKQICFFLISEIANYTLTNDDVQAVQDYQRSLMSSMPLAQYPQQQQQFARPAPQFAQQPQQQFAQQPQQQFAQQQFARPATQFAQQPQQQFAAQQDVPVFVPDVPVYVPKAQFIPAKKEENYDY